MLRKNISIFILFTVCRFATGQNAIDVINLSRHNFDSSELVSLNGDWFFYPSSFINPDMQEWNDSSMIITVPKEWKKSGLPSFGYGSYQQLIVTNTNTPLALAIPDLFSAYHLYINGELLASMGKPGVNKKSEQPGRNSRLVSLAHIQSDTLNVVIHISNFVHRKGGIGSNFYIGNRNALWQKRFYQNTYDIFLAGALIMGAFFFLGMFLFGRHERITLYFALFSICYAYRIVGWGNYILHDIISIPYHLSIRIEYATMYLACVFFSMYIKSLFPKDTSNILFRPFLIISLIWTLSVLLPVSILSRMNVPYLFILLAGIVLITIVFTRALINKRLGASYSLYSTIGVIGVFGMKTLDYLNIYEEILWVSMVSQLIFFLFQALMLTKHFSDAWRNAKEEAENASKTKSDFLSIMSHEIRTPLNAIIGTTFHLLEENPRQDQAQELNNLKNSSAHLLTLINNVLDYNKIEAGKIEFEITDINLKPYIRNIVNLYDPVAKQKNIGISLEYDDYLPQVVKIDKTRVNQIMTNLIGNAIKFTEEGSVKVQVVRGSTSKGKVDVLFSVSDTGIGVGNDIKDRIFKSFQQANTSITRKYGGTGLGLSITKELVELMGSKMYLDSEEGKGSTFYFTLSLNIGEEKLPIPKEKETVDLSGKELLLVEDNQMNVLIAKRLLEKWGINVEVANNGREALDKVEKNNQFDMILMDLQMPVMDGYEATKKLRRRGIKLPILALTASAMYEKSHKLEQYGLDGVLSKPFKPEDLFDAIANRIGQNNRHN